MADLEMKVVFLLFAFAAVLYGFATVFDGGPVYRESPDSRLAPVEVVSYGAVES